MGLRLRLQQSEHPPDTDAEVRPVRFRQRRIPSQTSLKRREVRRTVLGHGRRAEHGPQHRSCRRPDRPGSGAYLWRLGTHRPCRAGKWGRREGSSWRSSSKCLGLPHRNASRRRSSTDSHDAFNHRQWIQRNELESDAEGSDGARCPIIALALRIGGTVEYFALAASCRFGSSGEETATAAGLTRIQRLFGVVVQFALPVLGLAKGAGIGADEILLVFPVCKRDPARRTSDEASRQSLQRSPTSA
jgi:hypothetical protein